MTRHLSTLSILHYVYGAFVCLSGFVALIFIFLGGFLSSDFIAQQSQNEPVPHWLGTFFQTFGVILFVVIEVWGILTILSGSWIAKRKNRTGSLVVAGFSCLNMPLGILLGIFTFVVLLDEEVKRAYEGTSTPTYA
jgi:quinol-cytochrome oxidoreductase complex cytochrome b subunit